MNETTGQRIRRLRDGVPLTQAELACSSGVPLQTIKDIERGATKRPHNSTLRALSLALHVEVQYLLYGEDSRVADSLDTSRRS